VESIGARIDTLDYALLDDFIYPSGKEMFYGEQTITITIPAVPSAPNGTLNDHSGDNVTVNTDNKTAFFDAFIKEFYEHSEKYPRSSESKFVGEGLFHGKVSGYVKDKEEGKGSNSSAGYHYSGTRTTEYNDYSNIGRLYFGGGWATAHRSFDQNTNYSYTDTTIINGKVKFNGEFKGELDFQNFKYELLYMWGVVEENKYISGKVMIGDLDVTDLYFEKLIKKNY
jgi:hypothetical protein